MRPRALVLVLAVAACRGSLAADESPPADGNDGGAASDGATGGADADASAPPASQDAGPQDRCSIGPVRTDPSVFERAPAGSAPVVAPACIPHCDYAFPDDAVYALAAVPSGSCAIKGQLCTMTIALSCEEGASEDDLLCTCTEDHGWTCVIQGEKGAPCGGPRPTLPPPVISPAPGAFGCRQFLTVKDSEPDVGLFYTTDGSKPSPAGMLYAGPIALGGSATVRVLATKVGWRSSEVTGDYVLSFTTPRPATVTFDPPAGTYDDPQSVTLSTTTPGATVCFSVDGSGPSCGGAGCDTDAIEYIPGTPIAVPASVTIGAVACLPGKAPDFCTFQSSYAAAAYEIE